MLEIDRAKERASIQPTLPFFLESSINRLERARIKKKKKGKVVDCTTREDVPKPLQEMRGQLTGRSPDWCSTSAVALTLRISNFLTKKMLGTQRFQRRQVAKSLWEVCALLGNWDRACPSSNTAVCQNASVDTEKMYVKCNLHVNIVEREEDMNYFVIQQK